MSEVKPELESIRCIRTRSLREDIYRGTGNANITFSPERERRILEHQRRVQNELANN